MSSAKRKLQLLAAFTTLLTLARAVGCTGFFVNPTLTTVAVGPATPNIQLGSTLQMTATGTFDDGTTKTLTKSVSWATSSTATATVSSSGLVTGIALGSATITATSGTVSGSTSVTVTLANITSISVTPTGASILQGQTQQYKAIATTSDGTMRDITDSATWSSSNSAAGMINSTGLFTAASSVSSSQVTTISATSGGITGSTQLTVNP